MPGRGVSGSISYSRLTGPHSPFGSIPEDVGHRHLALTHDALAPVVREIPQVLHVHVQNSAARFPDRFHHVDPGAGRVAHVRRTIPPGGPFP